jgi:hypothetical protein
MESWHYSLWLSLISFCVGDDEAIISNAGQRAVFHVSVSMLLRVADLCWQTIPMTESMIQELEHAINAWRNHQSENFVRFSPSKDQHDNFHKLCHAPTHLRRNGGLSTTCTSSYEKSHGVMAKRPAMQHNHQGVPERRMLIVVRRAQVLCQRQLGSGREYTKAMYRVMRGDDGDFDKSSVHTTTSQVCAVLYSSFETSQICDVRFLRVEVLLVLTKASCSTTMAGKRLCICLNVLLEYCCISAGML